LGTARPDPSTAVAAAGSTDVTSTQDAWAVLSLVNEWVKHSEAKLGVVLAFVGVMAAGLITIAADIPCPSLVILCIEGAAAVLILASAVLASLGLLPRFKGQSEEAQMNPLFYGDVANHFKGKSEEYVTALSGVIGSQDALIRQIARQVHANADVASRKYLWANRSILVGMLGLVCLFVLAAGVALGW